MNKGIEKKGEGGGRKTFHSKELRIVKSYDDEQKSEYAFLTLTYEVLQILSISLTDKTLLENLFDKTNFNDVNERFASLIPGLFD